MGAFLYLLAALLFIVGILSAQAFIEGSSAALISSAAAFAVALYLVVLAGAHADRPGRVKRSFFRLLGVLLVAAGILARLSGGFEVLVVLPAVCAGILALLVAQGYRPEQPPASAAEQQPPEPRSIGDAAAAVLARAGRGFVRELAVARRAARQFGRRPALALVVAVLASAAFWSSIVSADIGRRHYHPQQPAARVRLASRQRTFRARWADRYQGSLVWPLISEPASAFADPFRGPTAVANGWVTLLWAPVFARRAETPGYTGTWTWRDSALMLGIGIPAAIVWTLLLVGLLGWVRDDDRPLRISDWPGYLRAHYVPVLVLWLILMGWVMLAMPLVTVANWLPEVAERWGGMALSLASVMQEALFLVAWVVPLLLLMFVPFAIVAQRLGAWSGIVEGLRLWRRRWLAAVALFVVFRVAYEVLVVWTALAPWPTEPWAVSLGTPAPALWQWAHQVGLALLGLWMAYAFMEIAKTTPANARAEGAQ